MAANVSFDCRNKPFLVPLNVCFLSWNWGFATGNVCFYWKTNSWVQPYWSIWILYIYIIMKKGHFKWPCQGLCVCVCLPKDFKTFWVVKILREMLMHVILIYQSRWRYEMDMRYASNSAKQFETAVFVAFVVHSIIWWCCWWHQRMSKVDVYTYCVNKNMDGTYRYTHSYIPI